MKVRDRISSQILNKAVSGVNVAEGSTLSQLWGQQPTVLYFLRHFG